VSRASKDVTLLETNAREFAFSMSRVYMCALMTEHAAATGLESDVVAAKRFCEDGIFVVREHKNKVGSDRLLALDVDEKTGKIRGVGDVGVDGKRRAKY